MVNNRHSIMKRAFRIHPILQFLLVGCFVLLSMTNVHSTSPPPPWSLTEAYSSADSSVEVIELSFPANNNYLDASYTLTYVNAMGVKDSLAISAFMESGGNTPRYFLMATAAYTNLPGALPVDFILPNDFFSPGGTLELNTTSLRYPSYLSLADLPLDGAHGVGGNLNVIPAYVQDYAGQREFLSVPVPETTSTIFLMAISFVSFVIFRYRSHAAS